MHRLAELYKLYIFEMIPRERRTLEGVNWWESVQRGKQNSICVRTRLPNYNRCGAAKYPDSGWSNDAYNWHHNSWYGTSSYCCLHTTVISKDSETIFARDGSLSPCYRAGEYPQPLFYWHVGQRCTLCMLRHRALSLSPSMVATISSHVHTRADHN